MVALEAWALGRPVLANGKCDVLRGQTVRSNAGLYYENFGEFVEAVRVLERTPQLAETLGRNGSGFFRTHYAWPVIERKYLDMFQRLAREDPATAARSMPPLPGWWGRRQKTLPASREVLAGLPSGPVVSVRQVAARPRPRLERHERVEPRVASRHHEPRPPRRETTPAAPTGGGASPGRGESGRPGERGARSGRFRRGRRPGGPPRGRRGDG
jgi:hypothetical protein